MSERQEKFTPGPWECKEVRTSCGRAFRIGKDAMLEPGPRGCCIIYDDYGHGTNERKSNAALIAAAPDLYEALKIALDALSWESIGTYRMDDPDWYFAVDQAKSQAAAALSKARGEE